MEKSFALRLAILWLDTIDEFEIDEKQSKDLKEIKKTLIEIHQDIAFKNNN